MRSFLRDAFVRRFIGGFALGLIAFAAVQFHQTQIAHATDSAETFQAH